MKYYINYLKIKILPILVIYVKVGYKTITKVKTMLISEPVKPYNFTNSPIQSNIFNNLNKLFKLFKKEYLINLYLSLLVSVSFTIFTRYIIGKEFELFYYLPFISGIGAMLCYSIITTYNCNYIKINVLIKTFIFAVVFSIFMLILIFYIRSKLSELDILEDLWDIISLFSIILSNKLYVTNINLSDYVNKDLLSSNKNYAPNSFNSVAPDNPNNNRIRDGRSRSPERASSSGALIRRPRINIAENTNNENINSTNNSRALPINSISDTSKNKVLMPKPVSMSSVSLAARSGNAPVRNLGEFLHPNHKNLQSTSDNILNINKNSMINPVTTLDKVVSFKLESYSGSKYWIAQQKTVELSSIIKNRYNNSLIYVDKLAHMQNFAQRIIMTKEDAYMDHCKFIKSRSNTYFYKNYNDFIKTIIDLVKNNINSFNYVLYKDLLADTNKLTIIHNILIYQGDMYSLASIYQYTKDLLGEVNSLRRDDYLSIDIDLYKKTLIHITSLVDFLSPNDLENRQLISNLKQHYHVVTGENLTKLEVILTNIRENILKDYFKIKNEWYNNYNNISNIFEKDRLEILNHSFNLNNTYVDDTENTLTYKEWLTEHLKYFEEDLNNTKLSLSLEYDINPGLSNDDFYMQLKNLGFKSVITEFRNANNNYISLKSLMDKLNKNS